MYIHIGRWMCACTCIYIHKYKQTYIHGESCMPNADIQNRHPCLPTNMFAYIHTSHEFQPRNICKFRVNYLHNFQLCIFLVFPYFLKDGNLIILEIKKFCKYGN